MAREELNPASKQEITELYDTIIVGGGIVGAGVFREQSLHKLKVLLLDQADFSSQTSQGSSKMLHGGIRYLENMDFALVFEALKEKNLWLKLTPHLTREIPFYLPVYKESKWPLFFMRIGLFLYDLLSFFKNSPHKVYNVKNTLKLLPGVKSDGLKGCGMYFDGIVDDAKLGLECIYDGLNNPTSYALNYKKVIQVTKSEDEIFEVIYQDVLTQEKTSVRSKFVIFATGPFTDQTLSNLGITWKPVILPSKGTHLWIKSESLPIKDAMVLQTKDGRIIFVIPQRKAILVGTTEKTLDPKTDMLDIKPTEDEIEYLLEVLAEYFPGAGVSTEDIISSFSAVRPLIRSHESSTKTSRNHKIFNPQNNMYVVVGGKYTTFRKMAQDINKIIFKKLSVPHFKNLTLRPLKTTSIIKNPFDHKITDQEIDDIIQKEFVRTRDDLLLRRLSLLTLRHLNDQEVEHHINDLKLKPIRESD